MENKSHAFIAGLFTVCLVAAALLIVWFLNMDRTVKQPYMIATNLSIPGLNPQATVRFRGMDVGKVTDIAFNRNNPGEILIHFEVREDTPITESTYATLTYQGVTGIASIELNDDETSDTRLVTTAENPAHIEMRASLLDELQQRGLDILKQVQNVSNQLTVLFDEKNRETMVRTFENISSAATAWEKVGKQLEPTVSQLPETAMEARKTIISINEASQDVKALTQKANALMESDVNSDTVHRLDSLAEDAKITLSNVNKVLQQYKQRPSGLLFGARGPAPGPGESGFRANGN